MASIFAAAAQGAGEDSKVLRAGVIGLDTSHAPAFAELLNSAKPESEFGGVKVVAAFPGGSPDIPASADRVDGYTKKFRELGIEIVPSIDELLKKVDVVLLESVDGRPHLEQVVPVLKAGKPVFVDKPVAGSLADAIAIFRLAEELKPDVIIMDLAMPGMGGLQATRLIKAQDAPPRVIIASHYDDASHREHAAGAGADGFVNKQEFEHRIPEVLRALPAVGVPHA